MRFRGFYCNPIELHVQQQIKSDNATYFNTHSNTVPRSLKKDMVMRVNQVAAEFRKVSNRQMAETTKRTIRENVSINAQLAKMSDKTMELIQENDELRQKEKQQKQHIDMLEVNEKELARKNISNLKVRSVVSFLSEGMSQIRVYVVKSRTY